MLELNEVQRAYSIKRLELRIECYMDPEGFYDYIIAMHDILNLVKQHRDGDIKADEAIKRINTINQ